MLEFWVYKQPRIVSLRSCRTGRKKTRTQIKCTPFLHFVFMFSFLFQARLDAIDDLMSNEDVASEAQELLRTLPDIERMMARIHAHTLDNKYELPRCFHAHACISSLSFFPTTLFVAFRLRVHDGSEMCPPFQSAAKSKITRHRLMRSNTRSNSRGPVSCQTYQLLSLVCSVAETKVSRYTFWKLADGI